MRPQYVDIGKKDFDCRTRFLATDSAATVEFVSSSESTNKPRSRNNKWSITRAQLLLRATNRIYAHTHTHTHTHTRTETMNPRLLSMLGLFRAEKKKLVGQKNRSGGGEVGTLATNDLRVHRKKSRDRWWCRDRFVEKSK